MKATDMYSLSVITFILLTGYHPFYANKRPDIDLQKQSDWSFLSRHLSMSREAKAFIIQCGDPNRAYRISVALALQVPFTLRTNLSDTEKHELEDRVSLSIFDTPIDAVRRAMKYLL